jgi:cytochrome c-type biogenesis protein CcmH/NrfF
MKKYRLKRNNWTLRVLPISVLIFAVLIIVGIATNGMITTETNIPDFKPPIDSQSP